ncbi:Dabb family protein [Pseudonocardia benzenivorans]|uniref:Stress responsive alpha-beta barrel domain-containing protein n=2 Tax=Pseudonocardia TaxID=1847 RepID=F4CIT7_PSEUX|nr:Dabb family protein [Pseudonocardia dioxanivorans]AEA22916.1 Stress responsive alpha-beta barrel domain-containing protein [Pseudonocardia dioxanivorans CB1190]
MIRNVVVGKVKDGVTVEQIEEALAAIRALSIDGVEMDVRTGVDLGLRDGNANFAITVDLPDEDAYRRYDADEEHNRVRRELFAPISASIDRIQFTL